MQELVFYNGWTGSFEEASVSVNDRGYIFGDGVYEVVRAYDGVLFALDEHLQRLFACAAAIDMNIPWPNTRLRQIVEQVLAQSEIKEAMVYIQVTRGTALRNHLFDKDLEPNLMVTVRMAPEMPEVMYTEGAKIISVPEFRWQMCHVKTISLQAGVLARHRARQAGADEAVFVLPDGTVTECSSSNIFIYKDGALLTHPADNRILSGITRLFVLRAAGRLNINVKVEPFNLSELLKAEEVFLTGTVTEVVPVVRVDGRIISNGGPGPLTARLHKEYRNMR